MSQFLDFLGLMGGEVVENRDDLCGLGDLCFELVEEARKFQRRAGRPGAGSVSARAGWRAAIEVFSSIEARIAFSGGPS